MIINNEKAFPIYSFSVKWSVDGIQDSKYPNRYKDLPDGRVWNSTNFDSMFKTKKTKQQLNNYFNNWWDKYKLKFQNVSDLSVTIKFKEYEVWLIEWFSHLTFDIGKSNNEILKSFQNFIDRKIKINYENGHYGTEYNKDSKLPYYCLMGAEDRWRWHAANENGESGDPENNLPPCRCKFCKEQGVVRIGH
jgi:hypothetical protein